MAERKQIDLDDLNNGSLSDPLKMLKWAFDEYHPKIALASSFGLEDVVLIDMMMKVNPEAKVFTLDTGRLHQETYDVMDKIREKYDTKLEVYFPDTPATEQMVKEKGFNLFYQSVENRRQCCGLRKIDPLNRALSDLDAWITGIRTEQTMNRGDSKGIELDQSGAVKKNGDIVKVNPLIDWTEDQVWSYIRENEVPYNALHDNGFPSIGCEPCTRAVPKGADSRSGRWWWEQSDQECGLHADHGPVQMKSASGE